MNKKVRQFICRLHIQCIMWRVTVSCVCKSWRPVAGLHLSHVHPSFWWRIEQCPTVPKFLVPEKSGTRMHGTREKLPVPVSGTRNLGGELGSCAMGLSTRLTLTAHTIVMQQVDCCSTKVMRCLAAAEADLRVMQLLLDFWYNYS